MDFRTLIAQKASETRFTDQHFPGEGQKGKFDVIIMLSALSETQTNGIQVGDLRKILTNNAGPAVQSIYNCLNYLINAGLCRKEFYGYNFKKPCYKYFLTDNGKALVNLYVQGVNDIKRKLKRGEKI